MESQASSYGLDRGRMDCRCEWMRANDVRPAFPEGQRENVVVSAVLLFSHKGQGG